MDTIKKTLNGLLLANKNGIPINKIKSQFKELMGFPLEYSSEFSNLEDFLKSMPDIAKLEIINDDLIVFGISSTNSFHVRNLIKKQNDRNKKFEIRSVHEPGKKSTHFGYAKRLMGNSRNKYYDNNIYKYKKIIKNFVKKDNISNSNKFNPNSISNQNLNIDKIVNNKKNEDLSYKKNVRFYEKKNFENTKKKLLSNYLSQKPKIDYKLELLNYTKQYNLPEPIYKSFILTKKYYRKSATYVSKVTINNDNWSSFPDIFKCPEHSENCAAEKALKKLKLKYTSVHDYDDDHNNIDLNDNELVNQIFNILKENGENKTLFYNIIPKLYKEKYKKNVPNNWLDIISKFPKKIKMEKFEFHNNFKIIISIPFELDSDIKNTESQVLNNNFQVLNNEKEENLSNLIDQLDTLDINSIQKLPPSLCLNNQDWTVLIIRATDFNELIIKLEDCANSFDEFIVNMYDFYVIKKNGKEVKEIFLNKIYAAVFDNAVFRVQALKLEGDQVNCFFLDDGIHEKVSKFNLLQIDDKFMNLPFQVFSVKLEGLDDFNDSPRFRKFFDDKIKKSQNSLLYIARPHSLVDPIKVTLYNTSKEYDINVNKELIEYLKNSEIDYLGWKNFVPEPELPEIINNPICKEDFFEIVVSHPANPQNFIVRNAIHFKKDSKFMKIDKEMQNFYNNEELIELNPSLIYIGSFICIKDIDEYWYRARVKSINDCNTVTSYLIDIGKIIVTSFDKIQPLFSNYSDFPMIAIRASLNDVKPIKGDWDALAAYEFNKLVDGKTFDAIVNCIIWLDNEPILQVSLLDQKYKINVSKYLIEKNFALMLKN